MNSLSAEELKLFQKACAILASGHGVELKARELAYKLNCSGVSVSRSELNSVLYRAQRVEPRLCVVDGVWSYRAATSSMRAAAIEKDPLRPPAVPAVPKPVRVWSAATEPVARKTAPATTAVRPGPSASAPTNPAAPMPLAAGPGSAPPAPPGGAFLLSEEQRAVVTAAPDAWLLVEAGPGTGKTAVACARVAHLLNQGLSPSSLHMVSFTRTAVAELRARIRQLSRDVGAAAGVRVTTLDSEAWHLGFAFGSGREGDAPTDYAGTIQQAIRLLRSRSPELMDWVGATRHLIIDEGQDLVGHRAELAFELLDKLPDGAGASVFHDPAQAIYGFSSDVDGEKGLAKAEPSFHEKLKNEFPGLFSEHRLTRLFRTVVPGLRQVFESGRRIVARDEPADARLEALEELARRHSRKSPAVEKREAFERDELVLFRYRSEVLLASSFLSGKGVTHRLRLSHIALGLHPWVAVLLARITQPYLTREEFNERWHQCTTHPFLSDLQRDEVWSLLARTARTHAGHIDMRALRRVLSRPRPPPEYCQVETGHSGPVLGTIHASKGREADVVTLMLPQTGPKEELDGEVRVAYVGATRARRELLVGEGYHRTFKFRGLGGAGGRIISLFVKAAHPAAQVEFGREHDLDDVSVVARQLGVAAKAEQTQAFLQAHHDRVTQVEAQQAGQGYEYHLWTQSDGLSLGKLNSSVNNELLQVCWQLNPDGDLKPPSSIPHLYLMGVKTVVLGEDHPRLSEVLDPWAATGMFLAPVIRGLSKVSFFRSWKSSSRYR